MGADGGNERVAAEPLFVEAKCFIRRFRFTQQLPRADIQKVENLIEGLRGRWILQILDNLRLRASCLEKLEGCAGLAASRIMINGDLHEKASSNVGRCA